MPNLNKVHLMGNMTRDVELKYSPKGAAIGNFAIAINRQWKDESGEKKEEVTFVELTVFGKSAETIEKYTKKGDPIFIEGRLKLDTWDDKQTGTKRSKLHVIVDGFQFLGGKKGESDERPAQRTASQPARRTSPPADPDLDTQTDDIPF